MLRLSLLPAFGFLLLSGLPLSSFGASPLGMTEVAADALAYFEPPTLKSPGISPDGRRLCVLTRIDDLHSGLKMIDLVTKQSQVLDQSKVVSVNYFEWKTNDLLFLIVKDDVGRVRYQTFDFRTRKFGELLGLGDDYLMMLLIHSLPGEDGSMLFRVAYQNSVWAIIKIELRTGKSSFVEKDNEDIGDWVVNARGEILAGYGYKDRHFTLFRGAAGKPWQRFEAAPGKLPDLVPFAAAPDGRRVLCEDRRQAGPGRICIVDPRDMTTEPVSFPAGIDAPKILVWGAKRETGAMLSQNQPGTAYFFNDKARQASEWLDSVMPGTSRSFLGFSEDDSHAVVRVFNGRNPGVYCVLNLADKKVSVVGNLYPRVDPAKTATSRPFSFRASDGLELTGQITVPAGTKQKLPVIVLLGDLFFGPRADLGFDEVAQYFSSRGFACIRVNHRREGSVHRYSEEGDYAITAAIAQDVMDGLQWVSGQGWVDAQRVGLLGQGTGGWIACYIAANPGKARALSTLSMPLLDLQFDSSLMIRIRDPYQVQPRTFGEKEGAARNQAATEALRAAGKISVPSLHFGDPEVDVRSLESELRKSRQPFTVRKTSPGEKDLKLANWRIAAIRYDQAAEFFTKELVAGK